MRSWRWMAAFAIAAVLAGSMGIQTSPPTATAQDYKIIDLDEKQVEPRLVEPRPQVFAGPAPQAMMRLPSPAVALWGDDTHLFIVRGDRVFKLEKKSLRLVREARLPVDEPMPPPGGMLRQAPPPPVELDLDASRPPGDDD